MNKILQYILPCLVALVACDGEKDPFAGSDSYITAFRLQQGEATFDAAIAGDVVTITAPEGFSLNLATATVALSEHATIYPDPAEITAWEEEHLFVVTARDNTRSTYKYTVAREGIAHAGAVTLATQEEVDAFGQRGVTLLDGNLVIGRATGADSIHSLVPLAALKEVLYGITLHPTCAITGMEGLENLQRVGGTLQVGALTRLETLALPALEHAGSITLTNTSTLVIDLPRLERVAKVFTLNCPVFRVNLAALRAAGTMTITTAANSNAMLASISLPALQEANEMNVSTFTELTEIRLPALQRTGVLSCASMQRLAFLHAPRLEEIPTRLNLATLASLQELSLPALARAGAVNMSNVKLRVMELPLLAHADAITLTQTPTRVTDFPALQTAGSITVSRPTELETFALPPLLQRVGTILLESLAGDAVPTEINVKGTIVDKLELRSDALRAGRLVGDDVFRGTLALNVSNANAPYPTLPALEGFSEVDSLYFSSTGIPRVNVSGIRKAGGIYMVSGYSSATLSVALPDLEEVTGTLDIAYAYMGASVPDSVLAFGKLRSVGRHCSLRCISDALVAVSMPALTTVGGNLDLYTGRVGKRLHFPRLTTVGGKLSITAIAATTSTTNSGLKSLDGLAALTGAQAIEVTRQSALVSYEGLKEAFKTLPAGNWSATNNSYNPTYQNLADGQWTKP